MADDSNVFIQQEKNFSEGMECLHYTFEFDVFLFYKNFFFLLYKEPGIFFQPQ